MNAPITDKIILTSATQRVELENNRLLQNAKDVPELPDSSGENSPLKKGEELARQIYQQWIKQQPNYNVVLLSGAGSSYGMGKGDIKGKTLVGLWDDLHANQPELLETLIKDAGYTAANRDLEALLTRAYRLFELNKDPEIKKKINEVERYITTNCSLEFDDPSISAHSTLLNKITKRKVGFPRIKIFTLNYDTLFEQAAASQRFTIIDGFSFSNPKFFYGHSYDHDIVLRTGSRLKNEDNFIKKVFHLYKLHGSVDWLNNGKEIFQYPKERIDEKLKEDNNLKRVLIYPRDSKFELSYEQPYFEMIGRLQQTLRTENTFLITVGFSFADKHIRSIIIEALKQNPSLHLLALTYPNIVSDKELGAFAEMDNRIMLVADTFEKFATSYPDNQSFSTEDPLDLIVASLAKKMKGMEK